MTLYEKYYVLKNINTSTAVTLHTSANIAEPAAVPHPNTSNQRYSFLPINLVIYFLFKKTCHKLLSI